MTAPGEPVRLAGGRAVFKRVLAIGIMGRFSSHQSLTEQRAPFISASSISHKHMINVSTVASMNCQSHIAADLLGGVPDCVRNCDLYSMTRLFMTAGVSGPIDLSR